MFKMVYENKDFMKIKEDISKVFSDLPIEIDAKGYRIKNISQTKEVAITVDFAKADIKEFDFNSKVPITFVLPLQEVLDSLKKIKYPIDFGEEGTDQVYIKSGKVTFKINKVQADPDAAQLYEQIIKAHPKIGMTKVVIPNTFFIDAIDLLSFSSGGVVMTIKNKQLTLESLKGQLTANYVVDVDVPTDFEWTGSFNSLYMDMIKKLAMYTKDVVFNVKEPDDKPMAVIVELAIAPKSSISIVMAGQKEEDMISAGIEEETEEEEEEVSKKPTRGRKKKQDEEEPKEDNYFEFEEDDSDSGSDDEDEDL
jgi:hypothetical protein